FTRNTLAFAAALLASTLAGPVAAVAQLVPAAPAKLVPPAPLPAPTSALTGDDVPNDAGRALALSWKLSPDDSVGLGKVTEYYVERALDPSGPWTIVDSVLARTPGYQDQSVQRNTDYFYRVSTVGPGGIAPPRSVTGPLRATSSWFNDRRYS